MNSNHKKLLVLTFLSLLFNFEMFAKFRKSKTACNISSIQLFVGNLPLNNYSNICLYTSKYFKVKVYDCNNIEIKNSLTYRWFSNNTNELIYEKLDSIQIGATSSYHVIVSQTIGESQETIILTSPTFNTIQGQFFQTTISTGIYAVNDNFCTGQIVPISVNYSSPTASFQWQQNDIDIFGSISNSINITESGIYSVKIFDTNCRFSQHNAKKVNFNSAIEASIVYDDSVLCENSIVELRGPNYGYNNITYQWQKNGVDLQGLTTRVISIQSEGDYRVKYAYFGCQSYSKTVKVIRSNKRQKPLIEAPFGNEICIGSIYLKQKDIVYDGLQNAVWYKNGIQLTDYGPFLTATSSGDYKLVYGTGNCTNESNIISVSVGEGKFIPKIFLVGYAPISNFCESSTTGVSAASSYTSYQWKINNENIQNANSNFYYPAWGGNGGIYTCSITNGSCTAISDPIQLNKVSDIQIFSSYNNELFSNRLAKLYLKSVLSTNPDFSIKYIWKRNGIVIPNETLSYLYTSLSGKYTVITDGNNCQATSPEFILDINIPEYKQTANSGNWEDSSTWLDGLLPMQTDRVNILSGHTIQMPNYEVEVKEVKLDGSLNFKTNSTIKLKPN